jgi:hypothetical protein
MTPAHAMTLEKVESNLQKRQGDRLGSMRKLS